MLLPKARGIVLSDEEFHDLGLLCLYAAAPERWAARAPRASKHWLAGTMLGRHSSCHLNRRGVLANQPRPRLCRFPATFRSDQSDLSCPLASALSQGRSAAKRAVRRWRTPAMDSYASTGPLRQSQSHLASGPQPSPSTHTGNAASCPACTPTLAVPSEPPLAHRQCLPRTAHSTVPWSHSCLRQRC